MASSHVVEMWWRWPLGSWSCVGDRCDSWGAAVLQCVQCVQSNIGKTPPGWQRSLTAAFAHSVMASRLGRRLHLHGGRKGHDDPQSQLTVFRCHQAAKVSYDCGPVVLRIDFLAFRADRTRPVIWDCRCETSPLKQSELLHPSTAPGNNSLIYHQHAPCPTRSRCTKPQRGAIHGICVVLSIACTSKIW